MGQSKEKSAHEVLSSALGVGNNGKELQEDLPLFVFWNMFKTLTVILVWCKRREGPLKSFPTILIPVSQYDIASKDI